jgi:hypothetical protein
MWMMTKREENRLLVFERQVLGTICGLKIENDVCWRRYNHELDKVFNNPNALNVTKTSRLLYSEPNPMERETKEDRNPAIAYS